MVVPTDLLEMENLRKTKKGVLVSLGRARHRSRLFIRLAFHSRSPAPLAT